MGRKRQIRWSRLADLDLGRAYTYLEERNPEAARRFVAEILQAVRNIEEHSEIGAIASDLLPRGRYRHVVCGHYRVIYRIEPDLIWILRVWDTRRNPQDLRAE